MKVSTHTMAGGLYFEIVGESASEVVAAVAELRATMPWSAETPKVVQAEELEQATTAGKVLDLIAARVFPQTEEPPPPTVEDTTAALTKFVRTPGRSTADAVKILSKFNVARVGELAPEQRADFIAELVNE